MPVVIFAVIGALLLFVSSLAVTNYFAYEKLKWPIWGIILFYWGLYAVGAFFTFFPISSCARQWVCNLSSAGGITLMVFGYSAVIFYLIAFFSFYHVKSRFLNAKVSDKYIKRVQDQHAQAVIFFFFTTWPAVAFVWGSHHRAAKALRDIQGVAAGEIDNVIEKDLGPVVTWQQLRDKYFKKNKKSPV